jgi:SAM-dependent methyltransferase
MSNSKTFLHVGCGSKFKDKTTKGFKAEDWLETRLDIDSNVNPDVLGSMLDMAKVGDASMDAIFSAHNIEHLYPHEVPQAIGEFKRVLKPDGFLVLTCPDLQSICALVAENKLTDPAYSSPAGPIAAIDMLYGHRDSLQRGNVFMAHRCGFTEKVLGGTFRQFGFRSIALARRNHPFYDLWMVATLDDRDENQMASLVQEHFPIVTAMAPKPNSAA